ncbi:MAG: sigma 54-interacting transcriptional regulator [Desulfopila sp.]
MEPIHSRLSEHVLWFQTYDIGRRHLDAFRQELEKIALQISPLKSSEASGPGLLLFAHVTDELCEFLHAYARHDTRILAIACTEEPLDAQHCWQLLGAGASDVMVWERKAGLQAIRTKLARWHEIDQIVHSPGVKHLAIGESRVWLTVLREVVELAAFTNSSVLVIGETGTGKELISHLIHSLDRRRTKGELVVVDCTTVARELSGSEFFGHERGAFTSAVASREGAFALANGGTLFLDEVGELPLNLQKELLRVIQEHTFKKVGSNTWQKSRFRLVCATNRDLAESMARKRFRRDLYHRLATWVIHLPPLRERREDILLLVDHFLKTLFKGTAVPDIDPVVRDFLVAREYPGNVRDLRNLVLRIGHRHAGSGSLTVGDIPAIDRPDLELLAGDWRNENFTESIRFALASGAKLEAIKSAAAETAYQIALAETAGDSKRAAARLGVSLRAVQARRALQKRGPAVRLTP